MNKKKLRKLIEKKFMAKRLESIWSETLVETFSLSLILTIKEWREILKILGAEGKLLKYPDYCSKSGKRFIDLEEHGDLEPLYVPFDFGQHAKIVLTKVIKGKVYYLRRNEGARELVCAGKESWTKKENLPGYYEMEIYDIPVVKK